MTVRILTGDCREVLATLALASFDLLVVDPPYGTTSLRWDKRIPGWPALVRPYLKPSGSMWVFGTLRTFLEGAAEFDGWKLSHEVVWEKHNGAGFLDDRFRGVHEIAAHFHRDDIKWADIYHAVQFTNDATARTIRKKGKPAHWTGARGPHTYVSHDGGPRLMRSVIYARSEHGRADHPTQKPLAIVEPLIRYGCPPGGAILDPFAGSGTVGIVAKRHGLQCTLIEANPEFAAVAQRRLDDDAPLLAFTEAAE